MDSAVRIALPIAVAWSLAVVCASAQTVYVSRMWHNHQPLYWPEWNGNGPQTGRVQYAPDSIALKGGGGQ